MGRIGTTLRWMAIGIVAATALSFGIFVMPPLFRDIALALLKAIAVAAYVVFVALSVRATR